jgi:hypothetical protein
MNTHTQTHTHKHTHTHTHTHTNTNTLRLLSGSGFHRELTTEIVLTSACCDPCDGATPCFVTLVEHFPESVIAEQTFEIAFIGPKHTHTQEAHINTRTICFLCFLDLCGPLPAERFG